MTEQDVADYLQNHPEFFERHGDMLNAIRLPSPHGTQAISLQERQMGMLRDKNKQLERRLAELLRYGHENDGIAQRFNRWTTHVLAERDPHALPRAVAGGLRDIFEVPGAAIRLWDVAEAYSLASFAAQVSEEIRLFANSLTAPYCGANTGFEAVQWLKPDAAIGAPHDAANTPPASVALIALRKPSDGEGASGEAFGLLVMGSPDARRFHDGMATDFLSQIGSLAAAALSRLLPH